MTTVLLGYDGSPAAASAITTAARLFPAARATVAYLWTAPFGDAELRSRLWRRATSVDDLIATLEREGAARAEQVAADGVALARAAGWEAEPVTERVFGGEGYELARLADERAPDVLALGSRGLGGVRALLGSTSDVAVHVSRVPVAVIAQPMLSTEREAAAGGPVVVGYDGSAGAREALRTAGTLFAGRAFVVATVSGVAADAAEHGTLAAAGVDRAQVTVVDAAGRGERGVAEALTACAAEHEAAVVVVGSRGRSASREVLLGSVAIGVLHRALRPVLVVPHPRRGD